MWIYREKTFTSDSIGENIGFVYCITNKTTGRKYVGKKMFWSSKIKTTKGKRKKVKIESDWQKYYGSNVQLKEEVIDNSDNYSREILHLCTKKGDCSYLEMKEQIDRGVLFSTEYYNEFIGGKIHSKHLSKDLVLT